MNPWFSESDFVGKSIRELSDICHYKGIAIFDLDIKDKIGDNGTLIWEDICIKDFIKEFPRYSDAIVERYNDFFGTVVLRIRNIYRFKHQNKSN